MNAIEIRAAQRPPDGEETIGSFLLAPWSQDGDSGRGRWTRDYANKRGESTIVHNSERVRRFAEQHRDRTLRSIARAEARRQAADHEGTIPALRAAWSDAKRDGLVDENVFAGLGIERRRGREEIVPLLMEEVHRLAEIATELNGTGPCRVPRTALCPSGQALAWARSARRLPLRVRVADSTRNRAASDCRSFRRSWSSALLLYGWRRTLSASSLPQSSLDLYCQSKLAF